MWGIGPIQTEPMWGHTLEPTQHLGVSVLDSTRLRHPEWRREGLEEPKRTQQR